MEILSFKEFFQLIIKNIKLLLWIAVLTIAGASIISFLLPEYYRSTTSIFTVKLAQTPVNETAFRRGNISDFGETQEAEQAIELLNSTKLREKIINQFDLYKHYEIPRESPAAWTFVLKTLDGNVGITRTKFNSIAITVVDKSAQMAANIANGFAHYLDTIKYDLVKERATDLLKNLESQCAEQQLVIDTLKRKMDDYSNRGVMSQFQRAYLIEAYAQSSPSERTKLKNLVDENIKYGEDFDRVERIYEKEIDNLMQINKFVVQTRADASLHFSQKFVIDQAVPAQKKYYPVRWLMVFVSLISSMIISVLLLLVRDKWSNFVQLVRSA